MRWIAPKRLRIKSAAGRRSKAQEKDLAESLGGRRDARSGGGKAGVAVHGKVTAAGNHRGRSEGDVRVRGSARVECKCTSNASFSVKRSDMEKLERAALGAGEVPTMVIEFLGADGGPEEEFCVMPRWALDVLIMNQRP